MAKVKVLMVDPPSGWKYGFPRPYPNKDKIKDFNYAVWLLHNGYPVGLVDLALKSSRFWESEVEQEVMDKYEKEVNEMGDPEDDKQ